VRSAGSTSATFERGDFRSRFVPDGQVGYVVFRPSGTVAGERLPVVFCLPGYGGNAAGLAGGGLPQAVDATIAKHRTPAFGLAFIDGGTSYWHPRTSGEDRMSTLVDEFVPMVSERFGLGGDGMRGIMGWSMGGYGALLAVEQHPELFTAVAAASPAVWPTYEALMRGPGTLAFDSSSDFAAYDLTARVSALAGHPVLIDCGEQDPFYWYVRDFVATIPWDQRPRVVYSPGGHDQTYWSSLYPAQIALFAKAFS
jgi:enterochelin esterase-like enzyme